MEANQQWTTIITLPSRPWLLVGSLVDVPLRDTHGRDTKVANSTGAMSEKKIFFCSHQPTDSAPDSLPGPCLTLPQLGVAN
jgi:hypothetical protein